MTSACFLRSSMITFVALSIPRFRSMGLAPATTFFIPALTIACARTVAVVVPSPAISAVLEATSFTNCAPMFCTGSSSSMSFATVTPSLVMVGAPKLFWRMTLRPLGPRVTLTALHKASTPALSFSLASELKLISLAIVFRF